MEHTYKNSGVYQVTVQAIDQSGHHAVLQLVVVVNGPEAVGSLGQDQGDPGDFVGVWPLLSATTLIVLSLWLGEHHVLAIFKPRQLHYPHGVS
jgi:hypothetical protein